MARSGLVPLEGLSHFMAWIDKRALRRAAVTNAPRCGGAAAAAAAQLQRARGRNGRCCARLHCAMQREAASGERPPATRRALCLVQPCAVQQPMPRAA